MLISRLEKENELLTNDLREMKHSWRTEKRSKEKLDKALSDTVSSIRLALKVRHL